MEKELDILPWLASRELPGTVSLQILDYEQRVVFSSTGKWLHPLLAAEEFLSGSSLDPASLVLHDRIAGRAAAALTVRMGFKTVKACMMSRLAEAVYLRHDVAYCADTFVERIACQTEDIIHEDMGLDEVHALIHQRAIAAKAN